MKNNQLISEPIIDDSFNYEEWVEGLGRGDECFVQSLIKGDRSRRSWYWRFRRARIQNRTEGDLRCGKFLCIQIPSAGKNEIIPASGIYEEMFGIQRLVPIPPRCGNEGIEHAVSLEYPIYEPRIDYRISGMRAWLVPGSESRMALISGAIELIVTDHHSVVYFTKKPSPNAVFF